MLNKLKKNDKKGFTLVELIVVLVILAILAALLVPALTGYIDRAKRKAIVAETRQAVMAAQTLVDEEYAKLSAGADTIKLGSGAEAGVTYISYDKVKELAEVKGEITDSTVTKGVVKKLVYTEGGKTCTYEPDATGTTTDGDYNVN